MFNDCSIKVFNTCKTSDYMYHTMCPQQLPTSLTCLSFELVGCSVWANKLDKLYKNQVNNTGDLNDLICRVDQLIMLIVIMGHHFPCGVNNTVYVFA